MRPQFIGGAVLFRESSRFTDRLADHSCLADGDAAPAVLLTVPIAGSAVAVPSVTTDKADYGCFDLVTITGVDFLPSQLLRVGVGSCTAITILNPDDPSLFVNTLE